MERKVLITAGSTNVPIDQVRLISNVFRGRTGAQIAKYFAQQGDEVTLITSSPELLRDMKPSNLYIGSYKTFDQLKQSMACELAHTDFDIVIHSSAVSDYKVDGVFVEEKGRLKQMDAKRKVSLKHSNLFLRMIQTPKLVDLVRDEWGFKGKLVKFKLEVGVTDEELIEIAKNSREHSRADFIVANCLEWMGAKAYIIDIKNEVQKVSRRNLPAELYRRLK